MTRWFALVAILALSAPAYAQPKDVYISFTNHHLDASEKVARFLFLRDEVLALFKRGKLKRKDNREFYRWAQQLKKPGFHTYGEGFKDMIPLISLLLQSNKGWVCCTFDQRFQRPAELPRQEKDPEGPTPKGFYFVDSAQKRAIYPVLKAP